MYIDFTAYTDDAGNLPEGVLAKINALCPDIDTSSSEYIEEDEKGAIHKFWYGTDSFYAEDGTTELEGDDWDEAYHSNEGDILETYAALWPLKESGEIKEMWISDGSQFGWWPTLETAQKRLSELENVFENNQ